MAGSPREKSPPELMVAFEALAARGPAIAARGPALATRRMSGHAAGFVGGNTATSLHEERRIVRLPEDARAA